MNNPADENGNSPVEVFAGTAWEVALVKALPENAKGVAYVYFGIKGTLTLDTIGGIPMNRIFVSSEDLEKAKLVADSKMLITLPEN
jgi:hypothetical protein